MRCCKSKRQIELEVVLLTNAANISTKACTQDAGWDIYSDMNVKIQPQENAIIKTGITFYSAL